MVESIDEDVYSTRSESLNSYRSASKRRVGVTVGALLSAVALFVSVLLPAQSAHASGPWDLPEGLTRVSQVLYQVDDDGRVIRTGPAAPGRTFFYGFELQNSGIEPVTVTGFDANFTFLMHPSRQGDFPLDHCEQFITQPSIAERDHQQAYPQTIEPGETLAFFDNTTYHYIRGPVSNECQQGTFLFGAPIFGTEPVPDDGEDGEGAPAIPIDATEATPTTPVPPRSVETAASAHESSGAEDQQH